VINIAMRWHMLELRWDLARTTAQKPPILPGGHDNLELAGALASNGAVDLPYTEPKSGWLQQNLKRP